MTGGRCCRDHMLPVQSVPMTTKVRSSNPVHGKVIFDTTLCDKVCQWLARGLWFSLCTPVFSTNKTDSRYNWNIVESGVTRHKQNHTKPTGLYLWLGMKKYLVYLCFYFADKMCTDCSSFSSGTKNEKILYIQICKYSMYLYYLFVRKSYYIIYWQNSRNLSVLSDMTSKIWADFAKDDTRLVFCNGKLMRTDIFFTRTTKPICNFMNPVVRKDMDGLSIRGSTRYFNCLKWSLVPPDIKVLYKILMNVVQILIKSTNNVPSVNSEVLVHLKNIKPWHRQLSASIFYWNLHNSIVNSMRTFCSFTRNCWIFPHTSSTNFKEKICDAIYCF